MNKSNQSFDSIIMECQDMLSIEDEVQKKYEEWLGGPTESKVKIDFNKDVIPAVMYGLMSLSLGFFTYLGDSFGFTTGAGVVVLSTLSGLSALFCTVILVDNYNKTHKKPKTKNKPSESSKFQFLKESYSGTIKNLNERLELVQDRISQQIKTHRHDREQVQEYSDILGDTTSVIIKIDGAILSLTKSSDKLSKKKAEINKSLNEYIGESRVIAQKEREIERLKVAQELSDRMKTNFHTTMEITKSVDVLTDLIMPGLKQLMSLKIPELIEKVNFECDKERVLLEINR